MSEGERAIYEDYRELRESFRHLGNVLDQQREVERTEQVIFVRGLVAADHVRWTNDTGMEPLPVPVSRLAGARSPYGLLVTGECMRAVGIFPGDVVILDKDPDRKPKDRELVVIRVGGEATFKRWCVVSDDEVELRDGDGNVALRVHPLMDEFDIEGFYITYEPLAAR